MSLVAVLGVLASCNNSGTKMERKAENAPYNQEKEFLKEAIKAKSPEVQTVEIIDSTVVFTNIYDGIIDVKAYTFDGDVCVEVVPMADRKHRRHSLSLRDAAAAIRRMGIFSP